MEESIKTIIIHRNRLLREGLGMVLSQQPDIAVLAQVAATQDDLATLQALAPHVIVLDFALPQRDGLAEARKLRYALPSAKILMVGMTEREADVLACIEAGVAGYLPSEASLDDLVQSIRSVVAGEAYCSPKVVSFLFAHIAEAPRRRAWAPESVAGRLTRREREIIGLIEERMSNKEIADCLCIEVQTVKNHVHRILEKLQLQNRREAAQYAREHGLFRQVT